MMNIKTISLLIGIVVVVLGIVVFSRSIPGLNIPGQPESITTKVDDSQATDLGVSDAVFANNELALQLYIKLVTANLGKNVFFSPYSISSALGMIYEGARGTTSDELANILLIDDVVGRRSANARIYNEMNGTSSKAYTLKTANALWAEQTYPLLPDFLKTISTYYGGGVSNLDFIHKAEPSRTTINTWVERQTNNKIKDLIPAGIIDTNTRLVLTNAIYFKGTWALQFEKNKTAKADFKVSTTTTASVDMMSIIGGKTWNYAESNAGQILELPYKGDRLSMFIVLQKNASMTASDVIDLKNSITKQKVNIYIPRFKMETSYTLNESLMALGMKTAFTTSADFSRMSSSTDLYVSAIVHKAFVEVNEEGTEAAAATGAVVTTTSVEIPKPIPDFRADHPFLFMIRDTKTDEILFMGKVVNPNL